MLFEFSWLKISHTFAGTLMTPIGSFLLVKFPKDSVLIPLFATHQDSGDDKSMPSCKKCLTRMGERKGSRGNQGRFYEGNKFTH